MKLPFYACYGGLGLVPRGRMGSSKQSHVVVAILFMRERGMTISRALQLKMKMDTRIVHKMHSKEANVTQRQDPPWN